ncbi:hypothetical protein STEG23_010231 [Scotinomys teguina]
MNALMLAALKKNVFMNSIELVLFWKEGVNKRSTFLGLADDLSIGESEVLKSPTVTELVLIYALIHSFSLEAFLPASSGKCMEDLQAKTYYTLALMLDAGEYETMRKKSQCTLRLWLFIFLVTDTSTEAAVLRSDSKEFSEAKDSSEDP